jgi:hypothetical protein
MSSQRRASLHQCLFLRNFLSALRSLSACRRCPASRRRLAAASRALNRSQSELGCLDRAKSKSAVALSVLSHAHLRSVRWEAARTRWKAASSTRSLARSTALAATCRSKRAGPCRSNSCLVGIVGRPRNPAENSGGFCEDCQTSADSPPAKTEFGPVPTRAVFALTQNLPLSSFAAFRSADMVFETKVSAAASTPARSSQNVIGVTLTSGSTWAPSKVKSLELTAS